MMRIALAVVEAVLGGPRSPEVAASVVPSFLEDFWSISPVWASWGARFALLFFYFAPLFFIGKLRTLSGLTVEERDRYVSAWETHRLYPVRQIFATLKLMAAFGYGGDPAFLHRLGYHKQNLRPPA